MDGLSGGGGAWDKVGLMVTDGQDGLSRLRIVRSYVCMSQAGSVFCTPYGVQNNPPPPPTMLASYWESLPFSRQSPDQPSKLYICNKQSCSWRIMSGEFNQVF